MTPTQKLEVVKALQQAGRIVAMVGDGVNDGPALRAAEYRYRHCQDVDAPAGEIAHIVVTPDIIGELAPAIATARATHLNAGKSVRYLFSTNLSEIIMVLGSTAGGIGQVLTPMQLLWINLISDVLPGIGLAMEAPEPGIMDTPPPRARAPLLQGADIGRLVLEGGLLAGGGFMAALAGGARTAGAMGFISLAIAQLLHAQSSRSEYRRTGQAPLRPNPTLTAILGGSLATQSVALTIPAIRRLLGVSPLSPVQLALTLATGVAPYLAVEATKRSSGRQQDRPDHLVWTRGGAGQPPQSPIQAASSSGGSLEASSSGADRLPPLASK